jgi:hypothetical protein
MDGRTGLMNSTEHILKNMLVLNMVVVIKEKKVKKKIGQNIIHT